MSYLHIRDSWSQAFVILRLSDCTAYDLCIKRLNLIQITQLLQKIVMQRWKASAFHLFGYPTTCNMQMKNDKWKLFSRMKPCILDRRTI
jgi:hypothetical protein